MVLLQSPFEKIPARFNVGVMLFMACFTSYMLRTNISINLIAMVEDSNNGSLPDYGQRFPWDKKEQSYILGGYFWGYLVTSLLGGVMAERWGGRHIVGISLLLSGIITGLSPIIASTSFWPIFAARFLLGVFGGTIFPALHNLVSRWAPPAEKGKFVSALLGGSLGTVVTFSMLGVIIENIGWTFGFYIPSVITFVFIVLWYVLVADSPADHPRISKNEREFIQTSLGNSVSKEKRLPPVFSVISSVPFLALMVLHYGSLWGLYFLQTAAPMFLTEALEFNLSKAGILSSLPHLARLLAGFGFGAIGDVIRQKNLISVTATRKSFTLFSHIIPGLFLISIAYLAFNPYLCVAVITLSLGFNGAATLTNLQNSQDLAPNFAGTLYGTINFVGTTSGFISPLIVAHFTESRSTIDEWQYVFWIGAAAYIVPAVIFVILGNGNVQSWNEPKTKEKNAIDTRL